MKFKIIVDSSANLVNDYIKDKDVLFESIPLSIRIGNKEYIDDDNIDLDEMMNKLEDSNEKASSSCPSPSSFLDAMNGATYYIVITISSKLSGSFNSATVAKSMADNPDNIFLLDSKATAGSMILLADKAYELIKQGFEFKNIIKELTYYRDSLNLLFILNKFDNLVRNGRMNKVTAFIASKLMIKPLCFADNGEISVKEKIRTLEGVYKRLVVNVGKLSEVTKDKICIICHTNNEDGANSLKKAIEEYYQFKEVRVIKNRGLCSFYALDKGVIVSFE